MPQADGCWCGSRMLTPFSPAYLRCDVCGTLVARVFVDPRCARLADDDHDFYGKQYWFEHQEGDVGNPNIVARARYDLPERCVYWLRTLLKYRLPPARIQELGSAHGGFVFLARQAGYTAQGLELSPAICDFAEKTFDIRMLRGPIETQPIEPGSLDAITLMDVLEHLPDPVGTMAHCLKLLRPDGVMIVQTPGAPTDGTYDRMVAENAPFLDHMRHKEIEHLFLFTPRAAKMLFERLGCPHVAFETAIFDHYDMYFVASRAPLVVNTDDRIAAALQKTPANRLALALFDGEVRYRQLLSDHLAAEADRAARLRVIQEQQVHLDRLGAQTESLGRQIGELMAEMGDLRQRLVAATGEAARSALIEAVFPTPAAELVHLRRELDATRDFAEHVVGTRVFRLLRGMGRWRFADDYLRRSAT